MFHVRRDIPMWCTGHCQQSLPTVVSSHLAVLMQLTGDFMSKMFQDMLFNPLLKHRKVLSEEVMFCDYRYSGLKNRERKCQPKNFELAKTISL